MFFHMGAGCPSATLHGGWLLAPVTVYCQSGAACTSQISGFDVYTAQQPEGLELPGEVKIGTAASYVHIQQVGTTFFRGGILRAMHGAAGKELGIHWN
jgi:hypothetical protein